MNQPPGNAFSLSEGFEAEQVPYRSVSKLAVAALVLGFLSLLALIDPLLWTVPVVAIVLCWLALRSIARSDFVLTGRWCALCGLGLAMMFGVAAPAKWIIYRQMIRQEARQFADEWWQHIKQDAPERAFQLTERPTMRQPRDETLWEDAEIFDPNRALVGPVRGVDEVVEKAPRRIDRARQRRDRAETGLRARGRRDDGGDGHGHGRRQ